MIYKDQKVIQLTTNYDGLRADLRNGYQLIGINDSVAVVGKPVDAKLQFTTNNNVSMLKCGAVDPRSDEGNSHDFQKLFEYISERLDADPDVKCADIMKSLFDCDPGGYYYKKDGSNRFDGSGKKIPDVRVIHDLDHYADVNHLVIYTGDLNKIDDVVLDKMAGGAVRSYKAMPVAYDHMIPKLTVVTFPESFIDPVELEDSLSYIVHMTVEVVVACRNDVLYSIAHNYPEGGERD